MTLVELLDRYQAFFLDAYGVLVDAAGAIAGAAELLAQLRARDKTFYIITNDASKTPETSSRHFLERGLTVEPERILTSGLLLADYYARHDLAGAPSLVLGPDDSRRYVELAGGEPVDPGHEFEVVVLGDERGFDFLESMDELLSQLVAALDAGRRPRLVVPNPDLVYPRRQGGFGFTAGAMAMMLEAALARRYPDPPTFERLGKPSPALYQMAIERAGTRQALVVGDQLETDIQGARAAGLDSALVLTGVSSGPTEAITPTYVLPRI